MAGIWLSIDWDFFHFEDPLWDWGHRETRFHRDGLLWGINAMNALYRGEDLREAMNPEKYAPGPKGFWKALEKAGLRLSSDHPPHIEVADSHTYGASCFLNLDDDQPRELLHFDAHHDLGYGDFKQLDRDFKRQRAECGSWLYHVMRRCRRLTTRLVYPTWKGFEEFRPDRANPFEKMPGVAKRVLPLTPSSPNPHASLWDEAALRTYANHRSFADLEVEGIFIARSGSWSPPWQDDAFIAFVRELEELSGGEARTPYCRLEDCDPLKPREFKWQEVEAGARHMKDGFKSIKMAWVTTETGGKP